MSAEDSCVRLLGVLVILGAGLTAKAQDSPATWPRLTPSTTHARMAERVTTSPAPAKNVPDLTQPTAASSSDVIDIGKVEQVTERYPDGKVKIEREVGQNAKGNFLNQGSYKMYDLNGEVVKSGEFFNGKLHGKWTQRFVKDEGNLFSGGRDNEFTGPFTSEATFLDGQLHGIWTVKDRNGQNLIEWSFDNGVPSGTWTWWHANGQRRLEAMFKSGALSGDVREWDQDGKLLNQSTYIDGKCLVKTVGWYTLGQKRFEGFYLRAQSILKPSYDWWNSKVTTASDAPTEPDQKHGLWTEWYRKGNKMTEGQYDHGVLVGKFTWWYENDQKQAEGEYEAGKKTGTWISWHPNGLKESMGDYKDGKLVSKSMQWDAEGKLVDSRNNGMQRPQQPPKSNRTTTGQRSTQNR